MVRELIGPRNAMTVDVEDYFQVSAFENNIGRESWDSIACRVEANVENILELFATKNTSATFFTLGWIGKRYPQIIKKIVDNGHELASHGWGHQRANTQTRGAFREDISSSKKLLEDISGAPVKGYRAPSYSICRENLWAFDELVEVGFEYSSSVAPVRHDLYGIPDAPRFPFKVSEGRLIEIPISTICVAGQNIHCSGGGWFRLFPYSFSRWAINQVNTKENKSCIFYFHPWELDPQQPRVKGISLKSRLRHYLNLEKMRGRLEKLLSDFEWGRVDDIFIKNQQDAYSTTDVGKWIDYRVTDSRT